MTGQSQNVIGINPDAPLLIQSPLKSPLLPQRKGPSLTHLGAHEEIPVGVACNGLHALAGELSLGGK